MNACEPVDDLDTLDVLGMLVAELALHPEPHRRAVGDVERLAIQGVREDGLRMEGVDESDALVVLACTLLAYDPRFEMGTTLAEASAPVSLNHPFCSSFCVLGGAACSR